MALFGMCRYPSSSGLLSYFIPFPISRQPPNGEEYSSNIENLAPRGHEAGLVVTSNRKYCSDHQLRPSGISSGIRFSAVSLFPMVIGGTAFSSLWAILSLFKNISVDEKTLSSGKLSRAA